AAVAVEFDESLTFELDQRLADGNAADAQLRRGLGLGQRSAFFQLAGEDGLTHAVDDAGGQGGAATDGGKGKVSHASLFGIPYTQRSLTAEIAENQPITAVASTRLQTVEM